MEVGVSFWNETQDSRLYDTCEEFSLINGRVLWSPVASALQVIHFCYIRSERIDTANPVLGESGDIYSFWFSGTAILSFILAAFEVHKGCFSKSEFNFLILPQIVITYSFLKEEDSWLLNIWLGTSDLETNSQGTVFRWRGVLPVCFTVGCLTAMFMVLLPDLTTYLSFQIFTFFFIPSAASVFKFLDSCWDLKYWSSPVMLASFQQQEVSAQHHQFLELVFAALFCCNILIL